jgi:hypothetical protein
MSPVILPTPDEAARLSSVRRYQAEHRERVARQDARDAVRRVAAAVASEKAKGRTWLPLWAEMTRDDARAILHALPVDPQAAQHREAV